MKNKRKILVTNALTYANGPLHLGHMVGYIQVDIWVRFQKMQGHDCLYLCGSDAHGTPIMLRAQKENMDPETMVENVRQIQMQDYKNFYVDIDNFYTTHSEENRKLSEMVYERLQLSGDITQKTIEQAYDPEKNIFLPDRYVKGTCPKCGAENQYGDSCEVCSATYSPMELKNPVSAVSGATPITKSSEHYFFQLPHYEEKLHAWIQKSNLQPEVVNKLDEWFQQGLQDWDISRDTPYFGFKIPGHKDKYFYVWLDAPIGYIASFQNLITQGKNFDFEEYWGANSKTELYHFIGKDIMYFHTLFWPATLISANLHTPTSIFIHGFLTIDGEKMSKSRGTFILANTYIKHLDPEYLRYYIASKISPRLEDIDLNLTDFRLKINADLIGKVVNIASRSAKFINKKFENRLSNTCDDNALLEDFMRAGDAIASYYDAREFSKAVRSIMQLADSANQYIDAKKPWELTKTESNEDKVHQICSTGLNLFRLLMIYLKPVLPLLAEKTENFLNIPPLSWDDKNKLLTNHDIQIFTPLMLRVEENQIDAMKEDAKQ